MTSHPFGETPTDEIITAFREKADDTDHATEEPIWRLPLGLNERDLLALLECLWSEVQVRRPNDPLRQWAHDFRIAILNQIDIVEKALPAVPAPPA
jgi:hypothetical protein